MCISGGVCTVILINTNKGRKYNIRSVRYYDPLYTQTANEENNYKD